jgi:hypothetical protein
MTHPTCKTCKYWEKPREAERNPVYKSMGLCKKTPHSEDMTHWGDGLRNVLKPEYNDRTAAACDGSGYHASLVTKPEHYCPMHSELENNK